MGEDFWCLNPGLGGGSVCLKVDSLKSEVQPMGNDEAHNEGMDWRERIVQDAARHEGRPVVRSIGVPAEQVLRALGEGLTVEGLLRVYPGLDRQDVAACYAMVYELIAGMPCPEGETEKQSVGSPEEGGRPEPTVRNAEEWPAVEGYQIVRELGRGGRGVVYQARQEGQNRLVALKMILVGEQTSESDLARFRQEAETLARLQHPGIVQVLEVGQCQGRPFLAMEYVAGGSLAERLNERPWDARKAADLVGQLALAMQAAHEVGVVHRDLKPENVLLTEKGLTKVTDFGLAKTMLGRGKKTRRGELTGTLCYLAPEQASGRREAGPGADVYALGGILYRLLTGKPPFRAETAQDTLLQVLEEEPEPVRVRNPKVPRNLEIITLKCLQKEPGARYASARDLAEDLRRFLDGESIHARKPGPFRRGFRYVRQHPGYAGILALLVVVLTLVAGSMIRDGDWFSAAMVVLPALVVLGYGKGHAGPLFVGTVLGLGGLGWLGYMLLTKEVPIWLPDQVGGLRLGMVALLPVLMGIVLAMLGRNPVLTLVLLVPIFGVFSVELLRSLLRLEDPVDPWAILLLGWGGVYLGVVSRLTAWMFQGSVMDGCIGAVLGTAAGMALASVVVLVYVAPALRTVGDPFGSVQAQGASYGITLACSLLGAVLNVLAGRRRKRSLVAHWG